MATATAAPKTVPHQDDAQLIAAAAAFGEIASLLVRSSAHAKFTLPDLEWLLVPALENGQFTIVRAPMATDPRSLPRAAVLWASVSDAIDAQMRADIATRVKLSAQQRTSGNNIWLTDIIGERVLANEAVKRLRTSAFAGRKITVVTRTDGGAPVLMDHMPSA